MPAPRNSLFSCRERSGIQFRGRSSARPLMEARESQRPVPWGLGSQWRAGPHGGVSRPQPAPPSVRSHCRPWPPLPSGSPRSPAPGETESRSWESRRQDAPTAPNHCCPAIPKSLKSFTVLGSSARCPTQQPPPSPSPVAPGRDGSEVSGLRKLSVGVGGRTGVGGERLSGRKVAAPAELRSAPGSWPRPPPFAVCPGVREALVRLGHTALHPPAPSQTPLTPEANPLPQISAPHAPAAGPLSAWRA